MHLLHHSIYAVIFAAILLCYLFEYTTGITSIAGVMLAYHVAAYFINTLEEN
jgi:hypothetical protein